MRVVLCCMAKNEHLYINDFVSHYLKLGFDRIYVYDNDDNDSLFIGDFIEQREKVEIINVRGVVKPKLQQECYTRFYNTHDFDWVFYCDVDEFLFGVENIKTFLERFRNMPVGQVRVKWKLIGDDGLIERDMSKPVYEVFKHSPKITYERNLTFSGTLKEQGKAFVRGGLQNVVVTSPHFASFRERKFVIPSCLPSGRPCSSGIVIKEDYSHEDIYLYHYMTKSLSEFVNQKFKRTDAVFGDTLTLNYYWRINKKTPEKIEWLKKHGYIQ